MKAISNAIAILPTSHKFQLDYDRLPGGIKSGFYILAAVVSHDEIAWPKVW
jgi:hypothetical protein